MPCSSLRVLCVASFTSQPTLSRRGRRSAPRPASASPSPCGSSSAHALHQRGVLRDLVWSPNCVIAVRLVLQFVRLGRVEHDLARASAAPAAGTWSADAEMRRVSGSSSLSRRICSKTGLDAASAASNERLRSRDARRPAHDLARHRIGRGVDVVAEQLRRLLRRHERLLRILQPLEQTLLREAVLLARENAEHALAGSASVSVMTLRRWRIVAAARLNCGAEKLAACSACSAASRPASARRCARTSAPIAVSIVSQTAWVMWPSRPRAPGPDSSRSWRPRPPREALASTSRASRPPAAFLARDVALLMRDVSRERHIVVIESEPGLRLTRPWKSRAVTDARLRAGRGGAR